MAETHEGKLCQRAHRHDGKDVSLRYSNGNKCIECAKENASNWSRRHPKRVKQLNTQWKANNRDVIKLGDRKRKHLRKKYYEDNREEKLDYQRNYIKSRGDELVAHSRVLKKAWLHTDKGIEYSGRRRGINVDKTTECTEYHWDETISFFGDRCAYCGDCWEHIDHIVPISKGGEHTRYNLAPACKSCNVHKNATLVETWYPEQSFFDEGRYNAIQTHTSSEKKLVM